jgi:hypothetical protein
MSGSRRLPPLQPEPPRMKKGISSPLPVLLSAVAQGKADGAAKDLKSGETTSKGYIFSRVTDRPGDIRTAARRRADAVAAALGEFDRWLFGGTTGNTKNNLIELSEAVAILNEPREPGPTPDLSHLRNLSKRMIFRLDFLLDGMQNNHNSEFNGNIGIGYEGNMERAQLIIAKVSDMLVELERTGTPSGNDIVDVKVVGSPKTSTQLPLLEALREYRDRMTTEVTTYNSDYMDRHVKSGHPLRGAELRSVRMALTKIDIAATDRPVSRPKVSNVCDQIDWVLTKANLNLDGKMRQYVEAYKVGVKANNPAMIKTAIADVERLEKSRRSEELLSEKKLAKAEEKLAEAEKKVAEAEKKVAEAEKKVAEAEKKVAEAKEKLAKAERKRREAIINRKGPRSKKVIKAKEAAEKEVIAVQNELKEAKKTAKVKAAVIAAKGELNVAVAKNNYNYSGRSNRTKDKVDTPLAHFLRSFKQWSGGDQDACTKMLKYAPFHNSAGPVRTPLKAAPEPTYN